MAVEDEAVILNPVWKQLRQLHCVSGGLQSLFRPKGKTSVKKLSTHCSRSAAQQRGRVN